MINQIRTSKFSKVVACYLALSIFLEMTQPMKVYALTSGPSQPEFNSFTPIETSDMVDIGSGDFNYNIPIMDVGGYPLNLAYNSGITTDQESSWVGLGWNLNVGQIERQIRGLPDDFKGDEMQYQNNLRDNITVGTNFNVSPALFGNDTPFTLGLGVQFNNYEGLSFKPSVGVSYSIAGNVQVGVDLSSSVGEGATLTPSVSISRKDSDTKSSSLNLSAGLSSRKGLENMSMSASTTNYEKNKNAYKSNRDKADGKEGVVGTHGVGGGSVGGSISFNNQSYTPSKRIAYDNINNTFNATLGGEVFGLEGQVRITGYGSFQKVNSAYKDKKVGAYGYENTQFKNNLEGVLDFNREKEQTISKNTTALPVTNYTYDVYSVEGQGVSGMFRPFRSQVSYLYNDDVADFSLSNSFGAEVGFGNLVHVGVNFLTSPSTSTTGKWSNKNNTLPVFTERHTDNNTILYEPTTFKLIGELDVDDDSAYLARMIGSKALRLKLDGAKFNRRVIPTYLAKTPATIQYSSNPISSKIKRTSRLLRNQTVQKITNSEADNLFVFANSNAKSHHTAGIKILQSDGSAYVYGKTVYNTKKVEATFDVSGRTGNNQTGIVVYNGSVTGNHSSYSDKYVNKITTPQYAHSYLITSVLSPDYEDIDENGPTDNDLGAYTKFEYANQNSYKWRIPYGRNTASYNEGLKTSKKDQKGNYIYGEKELTYLKKIETKTHVAFIDLQERQDARSVSGENGDQGTGRMYSIKSIRLYSKKEVTNSHGVVMDPGISSAIKPIKTAHFEYNYELCGNILNSFNSGGKLTLKKVYFTYRKSNMGKYTPYEFNYGLENENVANYNIINDLVNNPKYDMKAYDIWGNYKQNTGALTTTEFPFVEQDKTVADKNTSVWVLKSIGLPSGGIMKIKTESDDYKYVQNRKAMQMFKVVGAGNSANPNGMTNNLFTGGGSTHNKYIYVKVNDANMDAITFRDKYLAENINKPIYFKFLLDMTSDSRDYVSGYFEIDQGRINDMAVNANGLVAIPLKFLRKDGGITANGQVNPIAKAGWGFGRTYLNRAVYSLGGDETNDDFVSIVKDLVGSIGAMTEIFRGPNAVLETKGCAKTFDKERSWIRLENPNGKKLGGGLRVKKIELSDEWDVMNSVEHNPIYEEAYGQEYTYQLEDGSSSGVATFEPNASPENPFIEPFYGNDDEKYAERIGAPREMNYVEKPFGETFFPSARITYSKVTVSNLDKKGQNGAKIIKKHATGKVITEHYTSYDFPTIVEFTDIDIRPDNMKSPLLKMLNVVSIDHLTASQGFSIETNDMNGKIKAQKIYAEGQTAPISRVDYKYNVDSRGKLDNKLTTINQRGETIPNELGVNYDLVNDFNESNSVTQSFGFDGNLASFLVGIWPAFAPTVLPKYAYHENILRTATTTKVVHKTGILIEKIAYDLGSRVSTKNLAWDAKTGQVILTQTVNEFDDKYYNFNYPAYWYYEGMGMASENIDVKGKLVETINNGSYFYVSGYSPFSTDISKFFKIGDELIFRDGDDPIRLWVVGYNGAGKDHIQLMNSSGQMITHQNAPSNLNFKVVRSGHRNMQMASMAAVTSMTNPIDTNNDGVLENLAKDTYAYTDKDAGYKVVNASAVEYSDDWKSQCENNLPNEAGLINATGTRVNPYLYNTKGDWRAIKSYAYLAGRNNFMTSNRRKAGFFNKFNPYYVVGAIKKYEWSISPQNWTFASEVTKYSPYGVELENKDALNRYSAAQYGYGYKLPMAVASNSQYKEIGFDGFEDYKSVSTPSVLKPHFGFSQALGNGVTVTNEKSHTGKSSLAVGPKKKVTFIRKIDGCKNTNSTPSAKQTTSKR